MPTLFAASPFLRSAPPSPGYLNLFLRNAHLPTRLHRTFSARLLHGCVRSGWVRSGCASFLAGLPQPISQVHGTLMQLGNIPHGKMLLKMVTELPRKWRGTVMQGARYCHSNYVTNAVDAQTTYSFDDLISEGISQKAYKSKLDYSAADEIQKDNEGPVHAQSIGKRISAEDKKKFLVNTLIDMKDSKEAIYGTLDAWVAWEQNFPLALLKRALLVLEKEEQWHRIVQVIKWMLSKGQGITMGTYEQLIRALEKDCRPEEAHNIWVKKMSYDLHSVPWRFCDLMLSIYYRNNMLERLVKLFKDIESFGRKPPRKSIVRKVVDAYELLGLLEEKNAVLQKYDDLFNSSSRESSKKSRKFSKRGIAAGRQKPKSQETIDRSTADQAPMNLGAQG